MARTPEANNYISGLPVNSSGLRAAVQAERQFFREKNKKQLRSERRRKAKIEESKGSQDTLL